MKYKVGDNVKIKTWGRLVEEYGVAPDDPDLIRCKSGFLKERDTMINEKFPDRILTIGEVSHSRETYTMRGDLDMWERYWSVDAILCLAEDYVEIIYGSIDTRFEILDL